MNYLKYYKIFESIKSIDDICEKYGIRNYTINPGGIDVDGDVDLSYKKLSKLPVKFGKVTGDFMCDNNQLTTLEGCPKIVTGGFHCEYNQLSSLEGCPKFIGGDIYLHDNEIRSLEGLSDVDIKGLFFHTDGDMYWSGPLYTLIENWLPNGSVPDMDRIELFNDVGVVNSNGDGVYLSKLEYFHEAIGKPMPDINKIEKYYQIIE
jgi:hypothetical protein